MKLHPFYFGVVLLLCTTSNLFSQKYNKDAWNSIIENNWIDARVKLLKQVTSTDNTTKADAALGLALVEYQLESYSDAQEAFTTYFRASEEPFAVTRTLWATPVVTGASYKMDKQILSFANEIDNRIKDNGMMYAFSKEGLSRHYYNSRDIKRYKQNLNLVGVVKNWQLLGEFENISASGFDKDFGVVAHPEADYEFTNKHQAKIKWFTPSHYPNSVWLDLKNHFYANNSIMYAQTFCDNPTERKVRLNIGTSGSLKVWVNDELVFSERKERNNEIDTYITEITLPKGINRILLQIGESEINSANFACRITDPNNMLLNDLTFSSEYKSYNKGSKHNPKIIPDKYEEYFKNKIESGENDFLYNYLLVTNYINNDKLVPARPLLKKMEKKYPNSILVMELLADLYSRDDNETGLSTIIEKMEEVDPESSFALNSKFDEYIEQEKYDDAQIY